MKVKVMGGRGLSTSGGMPSGHGSGGSSQYGARDAYIWKGYAPSSSKAISWSSGGGIRRDVRLEWRGRSGWE